MKKITGLLSVLLLFTIGIFAQSSGLTSNITQIAPLTTGCLQKVTQLQGITYKFVVPPGYTQNTPTDSASAGRTITIPDIYTKNQHGFDIATFINTFPELVNTDANGNQSINYPSLIAVLVVALKEQQAAIVSMQNDITLLKKKLNISTSTSTTNTVDSSTVQ